MNANAWEYAQKSFNFESDAIMNALSAIDHENFAKAVDLIAHAERIGASVCEHTGIACMHFAHSLRYIEIPSRFIFPAEEGQGAAGFIKGNEVMVFASWGGEPRNYSQFWILKKKNAQKRFTSLEISDLRLH